MRDLDNKAKSRYLKNSKNTKTCNKRLASYLYNQ